MGEDCQARTMLPPSCSLSKYFQLPLFPGSINVVSDRRERRLKKHGGHTAATCPSFTGSAENSYLCINTALTSSIGMATSLQSSISFAKTTMTPAHKRPNSLMVTKLSCGSGIVSSIDLGARKNDLGRPTALRARRAGT